MNNSADYYSYGFYHYYNTGEITNNLYARNTGGYGDYAFLGGYQNSGSLTVAHNTIVQTSKPDYYMYGFYQYHYQSLGSATITYANNIYYGTTTAQYGTYPVYGYQYLDEMDWLNNDLYHTSTAALYWNSGTVPAFNSSVGQTSNIAVDPKFKDMSNNDFTPTNPVIANYGVPGYASIDLNGQTRTACGPDLGVYEFFIDHNASSLVFTGTNECGGYSEEIAFTFNNGADIDLIGARAYYTINVGSPGEKTVVETIDTVPANGSKAYTFMAKPVFNEPGTQTIEVGLLCDDSAANNTLTTTITITPAPHSFELAQGTTFGGYYNGGTQTNPDVTAPSVQVDYDIMNPSRYANSAYGSDWTATAFVMTENGTDVSGNASMTAPGSAAGIVSVSPADSLQDSLLYVGVTVTDVNTGCDSTFGRWLYVPHVPMVDFSAPDGCDGDVVAFVNETSQPTGATEYMWDFDDPNSGTENNMSTISDPVHAFSTYGSYDVKLTAWNFDYPKFVYEIVKRVEISPVPTVDFKVTNACEGSDISFTNNTSLPAGITGTIDYKWNFGDRGTSILKDPKHQYTAAGGYQVTLTASLRGCATSLTKNANQFATPNADFSVAGTCNLEEIQFTNASTIAIGNTGFKWDFNDGNISNLRSPSHAFAMPGAHTVKLTAISEFGCEDEIQKTFTLEESPKADFVFTDACSETDVEFTRTGSLPSGASSIFEWDFDGERISTRENDKHRFSKVGVKTVTLTVSSDNGCSDMISKEFVVKLQAKADFIADDVCEGEDVVFTNSSEVARGTLQYEWRFGGADANGNTTSSLTSPRHNYQLLESGVTESFRVTLLAIVPDGCSDSIAKTVTVNAKSDASFDAEVNWRNLVISNQATTDPTNTYNWRFGDGGRSSDVTPSYKYSDDKATYEVCLAIINNAGCISENCEEVELDLATSGINDIAANDVFSVYPNPNTGTFNVKVNDPQSNLSIVILDATGKTIKTVETTAHEVYNVDISDVAAGVYMVQVVNGDYSAMQRVTVAK